MLRYHREWFISFYSKYPVGPGDVKKFPLWEWCQSTGMKKLCIIAIKFLVILVLQVLWVENLIQRAAKIIDTIITKVEKCFICLEWFSPNDLLGLYKAIWMTMPLPQKNRSNSTIPEYTMNCLEPNIREKVYCLYAPCYCRLHQYIWNYKLMVNIYFFVGEIFRVTCSWKIYFCYYFSCPPWKLKILV